MNFGESESKSVLSEVLTPLHGTFSVYSDQFYLPDGRF